MTITISVSPQTESKLKAGAAASGTDLNQYATELLEKAVTTSSAAPHTITKPDVQRVNAWNSFVNGMKDAGKNLPAPGNSLDDSRESIYAGRGE